MCSSDLPWCSILVRNVFGVAGSGHRPTAGYTMRYAWPSLRSGSLPFEGGVEVGYRAEIEAADDPAAKQAEIEARLASIRSPFRSAAAFAVEEIIDPRDTRRLLCEFAAVAAGTIEPGPPSFGFRP